METWKGQGAMQSARPFISVVIPCFNEQECLPELHRRLTETCRQATSIYHHDGDYEIVLVNDGSTDKTWEIMTGLAAHDPHLVCVDLSRNHGHQLALTAGLHVCRGANILIIDADLQDPPELLIGMLQVEQTQDADVVYGVRRSRTGESRFKKLTASMFYRVLHTLADIDIPLDTGDFRLMSRRALDVFLNMPETDGFVRGMVAWIGMRQIAFPYDRQERFAGHTKYPLIKMLRLTADAITGFSTAPLKLASFFGSIAGLGSIVMLIYVFLSWASGESGTRLDELGDDPPSRQRLPTIRPRNFRRVPGPDLHPEQTPAAVRHSLDRPHAGRRCGQRKRGVDSSDDRAPDFVRRLSPF